MTDRQAEQATAEQVRALDGAVSAAMDAATDPAARLMDVAISIAINAPQHRGTYVSHAKIYWPLIEQLRGALDDLGIEWREVK